MIKVGNIVRGTMKDPWSIYFNKGIYKVVDVKWRNGQRMITVLVLSHPHAGAIGKTYSELDPELLVKVGATLV